MDALLDAVFGLVAGSWRPLRRAGGAWRDPHAWAEANPTPWAWLAAAGLLLPLVPLAVATVHFAGAAWRLADDDLMWVLGLLLLLPLAAFAVAGLCVLAAWALTIAFWVVTGREHADLFAAGYLIVLGLASWAFFSAGLSSYGWSVLGTTVAALLLVLAKAAARR